jgi:transcriptional antiterminator NusG
MEPTANIPLDPPLCALEIHPLDPPLSWFAIKVRTSAELRIAASLAQKDFQVLTPTCIEPRRYSDRIKKVEVALFPGYLFSRFHPGSRLPLRSTPGVDAIVSTAGIPTPIDQSEIDAILLIMNAGVPAEPWPYLKSGDKVQIAFGSLTGLQGILVNARGKDRLILSVNLLQRSISVEVSRTWVRPIPVI